MSINILVLGDVMLGENHNHLGRGIRTLFKKNFSKLIPPSVYNELIKDIDYVFYNFEYSLCLSGNFEKKNYKDSLYLSELNSIYLFGKNIPKIVNVANNHFSQHGSNVAQFTKLLLKKNNFIVIGETNKPILLQYNNTSVYFWGASLIHDDKYCDEYFLSDYEKLTSELRLHTKGENEKWIISLHWGDEYIGFPSKNQIELAHRLIDLGFDSVIGHHPHVIQPVEIYKDKTIIYSLGNFIFDQNFSKRTQRGLVAKLHINKAGVNLTQLYKSTQHNYNIKKIQKVNKKHFKVLEPWFLYRVALYNLNVIYRLLMKVEIIYHYRNITSETKKYYKDKIAVVKKNILKV